MTYARLRESKGQDPVPTFLKASLFSFSLLLTAFLESMADTLLVPKQRSA